MTLDRPEAGALASRQRFHRRRGRVLAAAAAVVTMLGGVAALLAAPADLAALRAGGVSLGWWAAATVFVAEAGVAWLALGGGGGAGDR